MDAIYFFISSLQWQDILDICISSYILFRLYALFRGTAAFNVMVGLAFLWLVKGLSMKLGLIVLSFALQGITAAAAIIIVVIFRNEIRTVFKTKNIRSILWDAPQTITRSSLEAISEAMFELGEKGVGALLVLPGKDDLDDYVQNGISWQGLVSKEMVKSIFWYGNPVHDGAAIVEGDKISRVGCILPLSLSNDLPATFGTRHRAAVGLSEQTDAFVLIVSEESGRVSTAKSGSIRYPKDRRELKSMLEDHLGRKASSGKAEKNERFEMALAAFLSFMLVSVAWLGFTRTSDTTPYNANIQYSGRAPGVEIVSSSDDVVKVWLSGASTLMKSVQSEKLSVVVDLSNLPMGKNKVKIPLDSVNTPPGVELYRVTPSEIEVTLDRTITKEIPVQIDWEGTLPADLLMVEATVQPPEIEVTGRSLLLTEVNTLYTEKIPLGEIEKSEKINAFIDFPEDIKPSTGDEKRVTVLYKVEKR